MTAFVLEPSFGHFLCCLDFVIIEMDIQFDNGSTPFFIAPGNPPLPSKIAGFQWYSGYFGKGQSNGLQYVRFLRPVIPKDQEMVGNIIGKTILYRNSQIFKPFEIFLFDP